jgi:hypothetical protein
MPLVLLATSSDYPTLIPDDVPLIDALAQRGIEARPAIWDKWEERWDMPDAVILRTVWDYHLRYEDFLVWIERVEGQTEILNPPDMIRWNAEKTYLRDLSDQGVPIVPTQWFEPGGAYDLRQVIQAAGWGDALLKPVVSASAYETRRVTPGGLDEAQAQLDRMLLSTGMMLQPYLAEVERDGEISLIYFEGHYSHAVRRPSALVHGIDLADEGFSFNATAAQQHLGQQILGSLDEIPLYARVDLAETDQAGLLLLELELIEPSLFFHHAPGSLEHFADAIAGRYNGSS